MSEMLLYGRQGRLFFVITMFSFFITLDPGPTSPFMFESSCKKLYEPQTRARLGWIGSSANFVLHAAHSASKGYGDAHTWGVTGA